MVAPTVEVSDPALGPFLEKLLREYGVSRETMAGYLRMSVRTLRRVELGKRDLGRIEMVLIAAYLGVDPMVFCSAAFLRECEVYASIHRPVGFPSQVSKNGAKKEHG
jgi:hypothetical protein